MKIDVRKLLEEALQNTTHSNYAEIYCGLEIEFHKRYEPFDNDLQAYHLSLAGDLKDKVQKLSNNINREFGIIPSALVGIALEVGINRAHAFFEKSGNIDVVLKKVSASKNQQILDENVDEYV
jgi:hypothetical protein